MKRRRTGQTATRAAAQANADFFRVPYVCFFDTSGNYRTERYDPTLACHREGIVFQPKSLEKKA